MWKTRELENIQSGSFYGFMKRKLHVKFDHNQFCLELGHRYEICIEI